MDPGEQQGRNFVSVAEFIQKVYVNLVIGFKNFKKDPRKLKAEFDGPGEQR